MSDEEMEAVALHAYRHGYHRPGAPTAIGPGGFAATIALKDAGCGLTAAAQWVKGRLPEWDAAFPEHGEARLRKRLDAVRALSTDPKAKWGT